MEMRKFEGHDWDGFAGAEEAEGKYPMIGYTDDCVVVVDAHGIEIEVYHDDEGIIFRMDCSYELGMVIAESLEKNFTEKYLKALGFACLFCPPECGNCLNLSKCK
jgi:hypothetical protein